jgi:hypothetical protein
VKADLGIQGRNDLFQFKDLMIKKFKDWYLDFHF